VGDGRFRLWEALVLSVHLSGRHDDGRVALASDQYRIEGLDRIRVSNQAMDIGGGFDGFHGVLPFFLQIPVSAAGGAPEAAAWVWIHVRPLTTPNVSAAADASRPVLKPLFPFH
jgi:hypothetical protein